MAIYGKLVGNEIMYVPVTYRDGERVIANFNLLGEEQWAQYGFKPIGPLSPPDNVNTWTPVWEDTGDTIVCVDWLLVPGKLNANTSSEMLNRMFVEKAESGGIDAQAIFDNLQVFPLWTAAFRGPRGSICQDVGALYQSLHDITIEAHNLKPSVSPTMWAKIPNPAEEWPEWIPYGGVVLYYKGAKVSHNGKHWISVHTEGNTWEPGVFGWDEVV